MMVKATFWYYQHNVVRNATHNFTVQKADHAIAHVGRLAKQYYTAGETEGKWVVDGAWTGMHPRLEFPS